MTKGRHVPPAGPPTIDHAANLRERLGRVAYEAQPNVPNDVWHLKPEHEREAWRAVGQAVIARQLQAFVAPDGALAIVAERGWNPQYDKE